MSAHAGSPTIGACTMGRQRRTGGPLDQVTGCVEAPGGSLSRPSEGGLDMRRQYLGVAATHPRPELLRGVEAGGAGVTAGSTGAVSDSPAASYRRTGTGIKPILARTHCEKDGPAVLNELNLDLCMGPDRADRTPNVAGLTNPVADDQPVLPIVCAERWGSIRWTLALQPPHSFGLRTACRVSCPSWSRIVGAKVLGSFGRRKEISSRTIPTISIFRGPSLQWGPLGMIPSQIGGGKSRSTPVIHRWLHSPVGGTRSLRTEGREPTS